MDEQSDDSVNRSIEDVIELMERELARLKTALETIRLAQGDASQAKKRTAQIRWHIERIDERQTRIDELRRMISH